MTRSEGLAVAVLSHSAWGTVWRRNEHFAAQLVSQGIARSVTFIGRPTSEPSVTQPLPGVTAINPGQRLHRRLGGDVTLAARLRATTLRGAEVLWINEAIVGRRLPRPSLPSLYDVTDDWRLANLHPRERRWLVDGEDALARSAGTVVCSPLLAEAWHERYGVSATLVRNGVDADRLAAVVPQVLPGAAPHVGYVGTLHAERLDVPMVIALAEQPDVGTVHLLGPDHLDPTSRERLVAAGVQIHPPVPPQEALDVMLGLDVLICPHLVTEFTLSLDAIKSYEYLSTGRPVVATPTSGFQDLTHPLLTVAGADFPQAVVAQLGRPRQPPAVPTGWSWRERAAEFGAALLAARPGPVPR